MSELIVAVELGTSKVACLAADSGDSGELEVTSMAYAPSRGMDRGEIVDAEALSEVLESVVSKVERHLGAKIEKVWCAIGGPHLQSVNGQGLSPIYPAARVIKRQDLHQVVKHSRQLVLPPDREQILAVPREFMLDGQRGISDPVGLRGSRLEVVTNVVTGDRTTIAKYEKIVAGESRKVVGMVPSPLGSGLGVLSQELMDLGSVVIDIGAGKTDVAVFSDGAFSFQSVIKVGADHYTHDIAQLLQTDFDEAERLKTEIGSVVSADVDKDEVVEVKQEGHAKPRQMKRKMLCEILESRGKEHCQIIGKVLNESGVDLSHVKSIVLTGGGSLIDGCPQLFEENLPFGKPRIVQPRVTGPFAKQAASPTLSTVVGIARYALESGDDDLAPISGFSSWKERISTISKKLWFSEKG